MVVAIVIDVDSSGRGQRGRQRLRTGTTSMMPPRARSTSWSSCLAPLRRRVDDDDDDDDDRWHALLSSLSSPIIVDGRRRHRHHRRHIASHRTLPRLGRLFLLLTSAIASLCVGVVVVVVHCHRHALLSSCRRRQSSSMDGTMRLLKKSSQNLAHIHPLLHKVLINRSLSVWSRLHFPAGKFTLFASSRKLRRW